MKGVPPKLLFLVLCMGLSLPVRATPRPQKLVALTVTCPSLSEKLVVSLFNLELRLYVATLGARRSGELRGMSLQVSCGKSRFTVRVGKGGQYRSRSFRIPEGDVEIERIIALAASEMLVTEFRQRAASPVRPSRKVAKPGKRVVKASPPGIIVTKPSGQPAAGVSSLPKFRISGSALMQHHHGDLLLLGLSMGAYRTLVQSLWLGFRVSALTGSVGFEQGEVTVSLITGALELAHEWQLRSSLTLHGGGGVGLSVVGMEGNALRGNMGTGFWSTTTNTFLMAGVRWFQWGIMLGFAIEMGFAAPRVAGVVFGEGEVTVGGAWAGARLELACRF